MRPVSKLDWDKAKRRQRNEEPAFPVDRDQRSDAWLAARTGALPGREAGPIRLIDNRGRMLTYWARANRIEHWEESTMCYGKLVDVCWAVRPSRKPVKWAREVRRRVGD